MKTPKLFQMLGLLIVIVLAVSACSIDVGRNPDGSLRVESSMTEASMQAEIEAAIADPLLQDFTVDLRDGYASVSATRKRVGSEETDTMTFRLDLGVDDGHLTATVSEVQLNDRPIDEERVTVWNERIATKLERAGRRNPDSTLQSVTISQDALTMIWRVETARSRSD